MIRAVGRLAALLSTPGPSAAVAFSAAAVDAVQVAWGADGPVIAGRAHADLPPGALTPSVTGSNAPDVAGVSEVLREVLDRLPRRPSRVAALVPDSAAKVSVLRFESLPQRSGELDRLVRWRAGKATPFGMEQAQVSHTPGAALANGGREMVVAVMHREVVETYERLCGGAGAHAGVVDVTSFNQVNAVLAAVPDAGSGDWLLVHSAAGRSTLAIVRDGTLVLHRHRVADDAEAVADLMQQTTMYYADRLAGRGLRRTVLAGESSPGTASGGSAAVRRSIEKRVGADLEWLGAVLAPAVADETGADRTALDALAAPVGVLLRETGPPRRRPAG